MIDAGKITVTVAGSLVPLTAEAVGKDLMVDGDGLWSVLGAKVLNPGDGFLVSLPGIIARFTYGSAVVERERRTVHHKHDDSFTKLPIPEWVVQRKIDIVTLAQPAITRGKATFVPLDCVSLVFELELTCERETQWAISSLPAPQRLTGSMGRDRPSRSLPRFWAGTQIQGNGAKVGQGLMTIPRSWQDTSFPYNKRPYAREIPFVDTVSIVRFLGGWNPKWRWGEAGDDVSQGDLAYLDENGNLAFRWHLLKPRLDPYLEAGYTNLILSLDNVPYAMASHESPGIYGQLAPPGNYAQWSEFIEQLCRQLVALYGFALVNTWSFRMGTENNGATRGTKHTFDGDHNDYIQWYHHTAKAVRKVLPQAKFGPGEFAGCVEPGGPPAPAVNYAKLADYCMEHGLPFDFLANSSHCFPRWLSGELRGAVDPYFRAQWSRVSYGNVVQSHQRLQGIEKYVFQFGFLGSEYSERFGGLPTNEPGGRGAAWTACVLLEMWEKENIAGIWHWNTTEAFGANQVLLFSQGWLYMVLDHLVGGQAYVADLTPTQDGTVGKALFVRKEDQLYIVAAHYNVDRTQTQPHSVTLTLPQELVPPVATTAWVTITDENSVYGTIRRQLAAAKLLKQEYQDVDLLASVSTLAGKPGVEYVQDHFSTFADLQKESLTLQPFTGSIEEQGNQYQVSYTIAPNSVAALVLSP